MSPALFSGADQDSRAGNILAQFAGAMRALVIGKRRAKVALDGNHYSRALQDYSRHHLTLTCGMQSFDPQFVTANIAAGDTHNEGRPVDPSTPDEYACPKMQWNDLGQMLVGSLSGLRSTRAAAPSDSPSGVLNFVSAVDSQSAWQNPFGALSGGKALFTEPCRSSTRPLLLHAGSTGQELPTSVPHIMITQ